MADMTVLPGAPDFEYNCVQSLSMIIRTARLRLVTSLAELLQAAAILNVNVWYGCGFVPSKCRRPLGTNNSGVTNSYSGVTDPVSYS